MAVQDVKKGVEGFSAVYRFAPDLVESVFWDIWERIVEKGDEKSQDKFSLCLKTFYSPFMRS